MPELPEVEHTRRMLAPAMEGATFERVHLRRDNLRAPFPRDFAARLRGQMVRSLTRRGKYLLAAQSSGDVLIMHLGMSGSFRIHESANTARRLDADAPGRHDHVTFEMSPPATITFNDPRRFGIMDLAAAEGPDASLALTALGPEPLSDEFDAMVLARSCRGKKTSLKAALMDQRVVAGLGNIYVSEALHRARLSPRRTAATIATPAGAPRDGARRLAAAIKDVLRYAIRRKEAYASPPRRLRFQVYEREGERCLHPGCTGTIKRITQQGRSTFFCPVCQK